ncbi:MAG: hypothetical protein R2834_23440 [Rhodothermales bacterium]
MRWLAILTALFTLAGCALDPRPLDYGGDRCTHCLMTLTDPRFGAELVTPQGKRLPFDAIECMAAYVAEQQPEVHALWVVDFAAPETLRPIEEVALYRSPALPSPMGMHLGAFHDVSTVRRLAPDGEALTWDEVLARSIAPRGIALHTP